MKIKVGQQFKVNLPIFPDSVIICMGIFEGTYEFIHYSNGEHIQGSSVSLTDQHLKDKVFDLTPIDVSDPAYIKDWKSNPATAMFDMLSRAERVFNKVEKGGGNEDEAWAAASQVMKTGAKRMMGVKNGKK